MTTSPAQVLQIIAPAFLVIALGYIFSRISKNGTEILIKVTISVLIPAFAWEHLYRIELNGVLTDILFSSIIIILVPGLIAWGIFRMIGMTERGIYLPIMFMNSINLPLPILQAAYGKEAIPFALMFYLTAFLGTFTLGVIIVSNGRGKGVSQVLREPVVYAMVLALIFNIGEVQVPEIANRTAHLLAQATIPMVLLTMGIQLAHIKISELKFSVIAAGVRLIGGALAGVFCVWLFQIEGLATKVVILESIMPCAIITSLVAEKYHAQPEAVASTILISTILSVFVIPFVMILLG